MVGAVGGIVDLDGTVTGNLGLHGYLDIGEDRVGTLALMGSFDQERLAGIKIDITNFAGDVGDKMTITGGADFETRAGIFLVEIDAGATVSIGDTYTIATAAGPLSAQTVTVYDLTTGIALEMSQSG